MSSELFAEAVRRSASRDYGVADLLVAIDSLSRQGEKALMLELYRIWLRYNPEDPLACAVWFNFGTALSEQRDFVGAKAALQEAIKANPSFVPPYVNLGNVCEKLGSLDEAVIQWTNAANLVAGVTTENLTYKLTALKQIGRVLEQGRIDARAEDTMRMSIELDPHQHDIVQHWVALRQIQCKWPVVKPWGAVPYRALVRNLSPLSAAALVDDPIFQLANAFNYSKVDVLASRPQPVDLPPTADRRTDRRLRIGYVSSDLREHAVGYLTSEIFELHDRAAVEVFAYYCGMPGEDRTKIRVRAAVDHWIDITQMSDEDAACRIVADGIDILVDLNAYTKDGRLKLFAMQPAPIIVNWLGYPGTTGSRFHNYIVADERIIPSELEKFYSEKVLRLPCYQPTDRKRIVSDRRPTRAEAGLPDDAIVYCCFNGTQKITPAMFSAWMTILRSVPRSVLWLLGGSKETNARLLDAALGQGIAGDRIVIADRMPNAEHLARYPLADVFLDTWPYGAHTTASDALWMGVPVVTLMGQGFAARVCGSLVAAAGCPELVTHSVGEYAELAVALGRDAPRVAELKRRLTANRDTCVLFDTPLLVSRLEALYREMWLDYLGGRLPLPDLTNLETIHEIACEPGVLDFESIDAGRSYEDVYRTKLIERRALTAALHDRRVAGGPAPVTAEAQSIRRVA
jgi:predicted O-linked N-acetylglucosamine transferase (SPINDLY family)